MDIIIDETPYQKNEFYVGKILQDSIEYPFTLEIIDAGSIDSDYHVNWQEVPPNDVDLYEAIYSKVRSK